jgi:protein involved in ribonucleotide reduction
VRKFLAVPENREHCVGVIGSGNINFGEEYARSGDVLSHKLQVPLLYKFELAGTSEDVLKVREGLRTFNETLNPTVPV